MSTSQRRTLPGNRLVTPAVVRAGVYGLLFTIGVVVALILVIPGLANLLRDASSAPLETKSISLALSVGLILVGLWGLASKRTALAKEFDQVDTRIRTMEETLDRQGLLLRVEGRR